MTLVKRMAPVCLVVIGALALQAPAVSAHGGPGGDTVVVHPGQLIQDAIDAARPGTTIVVEPGVYHESLQITTDSITLRGADPDDANTVLAPPAVPPTNLCTTVNGAPSGICVLGQFTPDGQVLKTVDNDRISGLKIQDFPASGVFGLATDRLSVSEVTALNDGEYGIARFASTGSRLVHNQTAGNQEAGLYVGDSPDADTVVSDNRTWNNGWGVFVRHSQEVQVTDNESWGNCLGVLVLDDGSSGGVGDVTVRDNRVHDNNRSCPPNEEHPFPISGGGIVAIGAVHTGIDHNTVTGNVGSTQVSGGVVLISAQPIDGGASESNDTVRDNRLRGNQLADIVWDGAGAGNKFFDNECASSMPPGLCGE